MAEENSVSGLTVTGWSLDIFAAGNFSFLGTFIANGKILKITKLEECGLKSLQEDLTFGDNSDHLREMHKDGPEGLLNREVYK